MKHTNCMDTLPVTEEVLLAQAQAAVKTLFLARMKEFLKLDRKGIPVYDPAYPAFDGEGMGFRIPLALLASYLKDLGYEQTGLSFDTREYATDSNGNPWKNDYTITFRRAYQTPGCPRNAPELLCANGSLLKGTFLIA